MFVEACCIVLGKYRQLLVMGIRHIAQGKINAPVTACNGHGAHRPFPGQFPHPAVVASGQNDPDRPQY